MQELSTLAMWKMRFVSTTLNLFFSRVLVSHECRCCNSFLHAVCLFLLVIVHRFVLQFYRYKMPRVLTKIEGRGNGIKTVLVNVVDVAKSLKRPVTFLVKFCGNSLCAQSKWDAKNEKAIVNGAHENDKVSEMVLQFVKKFVLCGHCKNPETNIHVRSKDITLECIACGNTTIVDPMDKLCKFIRTQASISGDKKGKKKGGKGEKEEKDEKGEESGEPAPEKIGMRPQNDEGSTLTLTHIHPFHRLFLILIQRECLSRLQMLMRWHASLMKCESLKLRVCCLAQMYSCAGHLLHRHFVHPISFFAGLVA
jgi:translation initiation factor 2 beta subunit (eIF-2beta)/eIF-5